MAKTVDVAHVLPLLVQLGAYDGSVALALAKAKAIDPETVSAQQSEAGRQAREVILPSPFHPTAVRMLIVLSAVINQQQSLMVSNAWHVLPPAPLGTAMPMHRISHSSWQCMMFGRDKITGLSKAVPMHQSNSRQLTDHGAIIPALMRDHHHVMPVQLFRWCLLCLCQ